MRAVVLLVCVAVFTMSGSASAQPGIAAGDAHTLILKPDGSVWAVGQNNWGQLGINTITNSEVPVQVTGLSNVVAVAAGATHSMALTAEGRIYVWGWNGTQQLGDSSTSYYETTPKLLSLTDVTAITAGEFHSVALAATGELYTWGSGLYGELGNGGNTNAAVPQLVTTDVVAIGAGLRFTLFVKTGGSVWGMGDNEWGALGDNSHTNRHSPVQMTGVTNAVAVDGGNKHALVLLQDGTLVATGMNTFGQLGLGNQTHRNTAAPVLQLVDITAIAAGRDFSLALDEGGLVWSWGSNGYGVLGAATPAWRHTAASISTLTSITHISGGNRHALALDSGHVLYSWGDNGSGQLADGSWTARAVPDATTGPDFAWRVGTPRLNLASGTYNTDQTVTVTNATAGSSMHYTRNGSDPTESDPTIVSGATISISYSQTLKVKAWKSGSPPSNTVAAAYVMKVATPWFSLWGNTYTSAQNVSLTSTTPGVTFHYTLDGSEPTAESTLYTAPVLVEHTGTLKAAGFKTGWATSDTRSLLYTMNFGTLTAPTIAPVTGTYAGSVTVTMSAQPLATIRYRTDGGTPDGSSPVYAGAFSVTSPSTVRAKAFHPDYTTSPDTARTYTITAATPTLSVGSGSYAPGTSVTVSTSEATATLRMTLDGTDPTASSPTIASGTALALGDYTLKVRAFRAGVGDSPIAAGTYTLTGALGPGMVSAGGWHSVMATPDGRVLAWGYNGAGQVGDGTWSSRLVPTLVPTITGITMVAAGKDHALAVTAGGQIYAWGYNGYYQLGDGVGTTRNRPWLIPSLTNVMAVAAGDYHSLALRDDGKVFGFGSNGNGQLGLGTATFATTPTEITGLSNVVAIAAGSEHSFAVTASGELYAFGLNGNGRLGDGTLITRKTPVLIGLTNVATVAAGRAHSLAMTRDGRAFSWGLGTSGQLGHGDTNSPMTPTLISGLQASAIAAGDDHSAAVRFDGVLVAWGASGSGQVGDTHQTPRNSPVVVSGPASVSGISLGDAHSLAATPTGEIWSWGHGGSGRLGDNGGSTRPTPQSILTGIANWQPAAPTTSAPSTLILEPTTVTVLSSTSGASIRYTTNGAEPTETDSEVPANGHVSLLATTQFRAKAFVSGRVSSALARAEYTMASTAPTITPETGVYPSAQTVTITAAPGPASTVRYTMDGSTPTATSAAYSTPLNVTTGMTVKARSFPNDGSAGSRVATALFGFDFGTLGGPTAAPSGGAYLSAPQVTLSSISGASIRYTLDGSAPSPTSPLYTAPISIPSGGGTLRSRAYHSDWSSGAIGVDTYIIDSTPPTIAADRSPAPLNAWHLTPVTVSFRCSDNLAIASCTSATTISSEGPNQLLMGTAIDTAGGSTSALVTVNIDLTPPLVTLTSPSDMSTTTADAIVVTGTASDALSGLAAVKCNEIDATVVDGQVTCMVPLTPGRNAITLSARDAAGHSISEGVTVTRVGTMTRMSLTPSSRTLFIYQESKLSLTDDFGMPVTGATWTTSNGSVVSLSADDPPVLIAAASGVAVITATKAGFTSQSTITIVAAENTVPDDTPLWVVPPTPVANVRRDPPIYTQLTHHGDPDAFAIETDLGTYVRTVRAMSTSTGEVLWLMTTPGVPLMGDWLGGLIAGVEPQANTCRAVFAEFERCYKALIRFGPTETPTWRYDSPGLLDRPAQAPDGTIYFIEHLEETPAFSKWLVILNGGTGVVRSRLLLPNYTVRQRGVPGSGTCENYAEIEPLTAGPIVGRDGFGYLALASRKHEQVINCADFSFVSQETEVGLTVLRLSAAGQVGQQIIDDRQCAGCSEVRPQQLLPDGLNGLQLVSVSWNAAEGADEKRLTWLDGTGARVDRPMHLGARIELVGEGGRNHTHTKLSNVTSLSKEVVDVQTGAALWALPIDWNWVAAGEDGGGVAERNGQLGYFNSAGQLTSTTSSLNVTNPVLMPDRLIGNTAVGLRAFALSFKDDTAYNNSFLVLGSGFEEQRAFGNRAFQLALPLCKDGPPVHRNTTGWSSGVTVYYKIEDRPSWSADQLAGLEAAIQEWRTVNTTQGFGVQFEEATIKVRG